MTDAYEVGYQIWDWSAGLPGSVVFPTPGDDSVWEDVTSGNGNFSVGSYYAYDNTGAVGWTPGLAEPVGSHLIKWRWKISAASPYQSDQESFEVLVQSAGSSADTYISVTDVRNEGILEADVSDEQVLAYIETWQQFLNQACRQFFVPKDITFYLDGNDADTLFLNIPIIQIEYLKINGSTEALDTNYYRAYASRDYPDDRRNPRIKLVPQDHYNDIFSRPIYNGPMKFRKGYQNQEIKGIFGFTEPDGSVPRLVKRALLKLVVEKLTNPVYPLGIGSSLLSVMPTGEVIREETDGHEIEYSAGFSSRAAGLSGVTKDNEILDIIKMYQAPIRISAPADWSYY